MSSHVVIAYAVLCYRTCFIHDFPHSCDALHHLGDIHCPGEQLSRPNSTVCDCGHFFFAVSICVLLFLLFVPQKPCTGWKLFDQWVTSGKRVTSPHFIVFPHFIGHKQARAEARDWWGQDGAPSTAQPGFPEICVTTLLNNSPWGWLRILLCSWENSREGPGMKLEAKTQWNSKLSSEHLFLGGDRVTGWGLEPAFCFSI